MGPNENQIFALMQKKEIVDKTLETKRKKHAERMWACTTRRFHAQKKREMVRAAQCLKLLEVATSPFRVRAWLTSYKGKFLGSSAVRGTYVCIDTTSPNEDTTSPGVKTTSSLDTTSL